jgi:cytochrome c biogenesis protein CcmG/thiol:disulfide interchange protein DsbE
VSEADPVAAPSDKSDGASSRRPLWLLIPLVIFLALAALFYVRLGAGDTSRIPSALINKPVPSFDLPPIEEGRGEGLASADLSEGVHVVNVWASWCGPCRIEIPYFQRAAARYGKRVGFLGIDRQDSDDAALTFLREEPVPYPSYRDPDEAISVSIGAELGMPDTAFYDSDGELVYLKQGPYETMEELEADIGRYALGAGAAESG